MYSRAAQADRETKISSTPNSNGKRERTDDSAPVRAEAARIAAEKEATLEKHRIKGKELVEEHLKKRKEQLTAFISKLCLTKSLQGLDFDGIGTLYHVVVVREMNIPCLTSDEQQRLFTALEDWCSVIGQRRDESDPTDDYFLYGAGGECYTYYSGPHWKSGFFEVYDGIFLDVEEGKQYNLFCEGCEKIRNTTDLCFEPYTTTEGDTYPAVYLCEACSDSDIVNTSSCNCLTRDSESLGMICSADRTGLICDKCAAADSSDTVVQQPVTVVQQPATVVQQPATAVEYTQFHNPILMMMKTKLQGTKIDTSLL